MLKGYVVFVLALDSNEVLYRQQVLALSIYIGLIAQFSSSLRAKYLENWKATKLDHGVVDYLKQMLTISLLDREHSIGILQKE